MNRTMSMIVLFAGLLVPRLWAEMVVDDFSSRGRSADPTSKTLSEIRDSERRQIRLDVDLQAPDHVKAGHPIEVTVIVTNLFDPPLLMNSRMLVNHPFLKGELLFVIIGPDGKQCQFQRLITPMEIKDDDFVVLPRGQSIQRSIELSDLYGMTQKGTYKIEAVYHNDVDKNQGQLRAWKGVVRSPIAEMTIQ